MTDSRFEEGDWPIQLEVSANEAKNWMAHLHAEIDHRGWLSSSFSQLDATENSGTLSVHAANGAELDVDSPSLLVTHPFRPVRAGRLFDHVAVEPGDVILTSRSGTLQALLRRASHGPVSQVAFCMSVKK